MNSEHYTRYGHLWLALGILVLVVVGGTIGYELLEGWSFSDSLYMTIITLATVGYDEIHPLDENGRIFTIGLIVFGVGAAAYTVSSLTQAMVGGQLAFLFGRRRLQGKIDRLKNHYIVCGYGRMGSLVCKELRSRGKKVVAVEMNELARVQLDSDEFLYVFGDGTEEDVLLKAGVDRAKALVAAVHTDADNLYLVLTARQLNPALYIVSRAGEVPAERKLLRAGANRVVCPYHIGGIRMAQAVLRPAVVDFLDMTLRGEKLDLRMEGLHVGPSSPLADKTLKDSRIREKLGLNIIAIKRSDGEMILNPPPETNIKPGDVLITVGTEKTLTGLEKMLNSSPAGF